MMQIKIPLFFLVIITCLLHACNSNKIKNESIEGIWQSVGYGKILKIDSVKYTYFDITNISCSSAREGDISAIEKAMNIVNDTLAVKRGYSTYYYTRAKEFPDLCQQNNRDTNDPLYNFEVFADTYKAHYAYFELNNIDWDSLYSSSKNKITSKTTRAELYLILEEMLHHLNDNHGYIEPTDDVYELAEKTKKRG